MAWTSNIDLIQKLYIAFYGRPADPGGLRYWASQLPDNATPDSAATRELISRFINSQESQDRFGSPSLDSAIARIYTYAFHRDANDADKALYTGKTVVDVLVNVISVSSGPDYASLNNKLEYAKWFTAYLDPNGDGIPNDDSTGTKFYATFYGNTDATDIAAKLNSIDTANPAVKSNVLNDVISIADSGDAIKTNPPTTGQTFTLTTGLDNIVGTSGDDTINATHNTVTLGDVIDGAGGNDTLYVGDTGSTSGVNFNLATIKNIENLTYQAANNAANTLNLTGLSGLQSVTYQDLNSTAQNVTINTKGNATSVTVKNAAVVNVTDTATTDTLTSVSIDGNSGAATITSDALTSLSLANTNQNATVTATGTHTLNVTVNNVTGGTINDDNATSVTVTGSGAKSSGFTLTTDAATSLAFAGDEALSLALADTGGNAAVVSSITSTNTAGVTITSSLGTSIAFTGGAGNDKVTVGATTKAIDMGAGDDTVNVTLSSGDLGTGGSINGGDGTDTLGLTAADAAAAVTALGAKLTSFERIALSSATNQTIDMAKLNNINYVSEAGDGNTLTLNNFANNGTFVFTDNSTATAINVKDAATGTSDVLNLVVTGSAAVAAGTVTVANVETINLNADDTATSPGGGFAHTMTLTAAAAKTLNVFGDAGVTLTLTGSTALETINTSGVTKGAVSVTTVADKSVTMTGGDTDTTFDASSITTATNSATITTGAGNDTITGGAGDDIINAGNGTNTITGGGGKDIMTGGTGVDTYVYNAVTDSQGTKVDVITNFQVGTGGDVIDLNGITGGKGNFLGVANGYGAVLTSLTGTAGDTVLDASTSTLYVDVDGDAALTSADMAIQLTGVTSGLVAANFVF